MRLVLGLPKNDHHPVAARVVREVHRTAIAGFGLEHGD